MKVEKFKIWAILTNKWTTVERERDLFKYVIWDLYFKVGAFSFAAAFLVHCRWIVTFDYFYDLNQCRIHALSFMMNGLSPNDRYERLQCSTFHLSVFFLTFDVASACWLPWLTKWCGWKSPILRAMIWVSSNATAFFTKRKPPEPLIFDKEKALATGKARIFFANWGGEG